MVLLVERRRSPDVELKAGTYALAARKDLSEEDGYELSIEKREHRGFIIVSVLGYATKEHERNAFQFAGYSTNILMLRSIYVRWNRSML